MEEEFVLSFHDVVPGMEWNSGHQAYYKYLYPQSHLATLRGSWGDERERGGDNLHIARGT